MGAIIPVSMGLNGTDRVGGFSPQRRGDAEELFAADLTKGAALAANHLYAFASNSRLKPLLQTQRNLCASAPLRFNNQFSLRLCGELFPRSRVRFVIHAGEVLKIEVGIDLGRAQVGVTEQFLNCAQIVG